MSASFQNPHYRYCGVVVQEFDPDRHVASLFAPATARPHLAALHAFALEIGRMRSSVSEAAPGEIRLQWWREALAGERASEAAANPVSAVLLATMAEHKLPLKPLLDLIEARSFDLYDDPMPDWATLEGYLGETQSALFQLSVMILDPSAAPSAAEAAGHAGVAFGITGLLRAFPWHARRGQVYLPSQLLATVGSSRDAVLAGTDGEGLRAALASAREKSRKHRSDAMLALRALPPHVRPAFLPLATTELYLREMERGNYNPFVDIIDAAQWRRIWRMWRWSRALPEES